MTERDDRCAHQRKTGARQRNVIAAVEKEELIAALLEGLESRDGPRASKIHIPLARRIVADCEYGVRLDLEALRAERREGHSGVDGRLGKALTHRRFEGPLDANDTCRYDTTLTPIGADAAENRRDTAACH